MDCAVFCAKIVSKPACALAFPWLGGPGIHHILAGARLETQTHAMGPGRAGCSGRLDEPEVIRWFRSAPGHLCATNPRGICP